MRLNNTLSFCAMSALLLLTGCAKESLDVAQDVGLLPSTCGSDGARLQATTGEGAFCASAQILAVGDESSVTISGFDLTGTSIVLQVDSLGVGSRPMTEAQNGLLYMRSGTSYTNGPNTEGTLTIEIHDAATRRLKGAFQSSLINIQNGTEQSVQGQFDVTYTIEG
jgi:hypothetical protein